MRRISKDFFLGSFIGAYIISCVFGALAGVSIARQEMQGAIVFGVHIVLVLIYVQIIGLVLWYKAWASIQDGHARTTPGKAVGFSFIPLFNIYWMFQIIWGFSKDYNAYVRRHETGTKLLPELFFLILNILLLISTVIIFIPILWISFAVNLVIFVLFLFGVSKICDAVNTLPVSKLLPVSVSRLRTSPIRAGIAVLFILIITFSEISIFQSVSKRLKVDLTEQKLYTLSDGTKSILAKLNQPIKAKLYYAKTAALKGPDQIKYFNNYYEFVKALLEEYVAQSHGMVELQVIDPRPFSDDEVAAMRYGLQQYRITEEENFFFGLVVQTEFGVEKVIPFFSPDRQNFIEYDISYLIDTAITRQKTKIGIMSSLPLMGDDMSGYMAQMMLSQGQRPKPPWTIVEHLRKKYEVTEVSTDVNDINDVDILLVIHPKELPEKTLFAIDQYVLKGGRTIVCVDPYCYSDTQNQMAMQMGMQQSRSSDLNVLLRNWGLEMPADTFAGDKKLAEVQAINRNSRPELIIGLLNLGQGCFNTKTVATAELNEVRVLFSGVLNEVVDDSNRPEEDKSRIEKTPLIMTTDEGNTFTISNPYELIALNPSALMSRFVSGRKPVTLGYLLTGRFKSSYPDGIEIETESADPNDPNETIKSKERIKGLAKAQKDCAVAVFADVDFISDTLAYSNSFFGKVVIGDNSALMLNMIDDLSGSSDLVSIRSRGNFKRPFIKIDEIEKQAEEETAQEVVLLNAQIAGFQSELQSILAQAKEGQEVVIGSSLLAKQRDIELKKRQAQQQLNEVKLNKRKRIEHLGNIFKGFNMLAAPAVILLIAVVLGIYRSVKKRHYISHASDA